MSISQNSISKLNILSANVRGFGQKAKRTALFLHVKSYNPDFIILCDTRLCDSSESELANEKDYFCIFNSFSLYSRGVAILINKKFLWNMMLNIWMRMATSWLSWQNMTIKNSCSQAFMDQMRMTPVFFSTLFNKLMSVDCPLQIIAGDFNVTLDKIFCGYF